MRTYFRFIGPIMEENDLLKILVVAFRVLLHNPMTKAAFCHGELKCSQIAPKGVAFKKPNSYCVAQLLRLWLNFKHFLLRRPSHPLRDICWAKILHT